METLYRFNPAHADLVHDLAYDYYGQRLATCSSDQVLKVWDLAGTAQGGSQIDANGVGGDGVGGSPWVLNDAWRAHDASILKVAWAHPEYGQVLASCSFDRSIRIWEEDQSAATVSSSTSAAAASTATGTPGDTSATSRRWLEKARLVDSRGSVQDIAFAPNHLGLKLATVSVDGTLRIYEAMDVINLAHWTLMEDFEVKAMSSTSANAAATTTASSNGTGGSIGALATAAASQMGEAEYCLSWCPARFLPPMLVVGCGRENTARIYRYDEASRNWRAGDTLSGHEDTVHDVAWAPSLGRGYQLIATACKDKRVRIYKLTERNVNGATNNDGDIAMGERGAATMGVMATTTKGNGGATGIGFETELVATFAEHEAEVWRVEWNITGTILASTGDDGRVMLWKANYLGEWACMSVISTVDGSVSTPSSSASLDAQEAR